MVRQSSCLVDVIPASCSNWDCLLGARDVAAAVRQHTPQQLWDKLRGAGALKAKCWRRRQEG